MVADFLFEVVLLKLQFVICGVTFHLGHELLIVGFKYKWCVHFIYLRAFYRRHFFAPPL